MAEMYSVSLDTDCRVSAEKRQSRGGDFNSPDICWKPQLANSRMCNRSPTCSANSFISQRRKFPGGTVILYSFLANQEELVGISTVLSNLGASHHIILEFMIGWEGKDSHTYYNLFNWIPNNLEILDMRTLEGKLYQLLKIQFQLWNIKPSKGDWNVGGTWKSPWIPRERINGQRQTCTEGDNTFSITGDNCFGEGIEHSSRFGWPETGHVCASWTWLVLYLQSASL